MLSQLTKLLAIYTIYHSVYAFENLDNNTCGKHFGKLIGKSFLTKAYNNGNSSCISRKDNYINISSMSSPAFTGMKCQCVEYARRRLIENKNITFGEVEYAYHIWKLDYAEDIRSRKKIFLQRCKNKHSTQAPVIGDLLIYSNDIVVTGHVAVIVGIDDDSILIAEQNYFNRKWESPHYARRLLLNKNNKGQYRIFDESLIGWIHLPL